MDMTPALSGAQKLESDTIGTDAVTEMTKHLVSGHD